MARMERNTVNGARAPRASIEMHAVRDAGGRVIWAEVFCGGRRQIRDMEELRLCFGAGAGLKWLLEDGAGNAAEITPGGHGIRLGDDGFTLRVDEGMARRGLSVKCMLCMD